MIEIGFTWHSVYGTYLAVAVVVTFLMGFVNNYHPKDDQTEDSSSSSFDKVFAAVQLLWKVRQCSSSYIMRIHPYSICIPLKMKQSILTKKYRTLK